MSNKPITKKKVLDFLHSIPEEEAWDIIKMYDMCGLWDNIDIAIEG